MEDEPLYRVGDVVASCDFDSTSSSYHGLNTGCPGIVFSEFGNADFSVASASDSADTGPAADHTGDGGKYRSRSSRWSLKNCVVLML